MKISISSPKIEIPANANEAEFELSDWKRNFEALMFFRLMGKRSKLCGKDVLLVKKPFNTFSFVVEENDQIVFLSEYKQHSTDYGNTITQNVVWSNSKYCKGYATKLLTYYATQYDCLQTSPYQYYPGSQMWIKFVTKNLKNFCFTVEFGNIKTIVQTIDQFQSMIPRLWCQSDECAKNLIYVTKLRL